MADYKLRFFDTNGVLQAEVVDFLHLGYTRRVNAPGILPYRLAGDHRVLESLADKWEIEVWRREAGFDWERELVALHRDEDWSQNEDGLDLFDGLAVGILDMAAWRVVNWAAGVNLRSQFVNDPGETIMKNLVDYNLGPNATAANGRKRDGAISSISVETDGGGGNNVDWYCHGQNVLESLQKLARLAGGDFDLVKQGANDYEFRWYAGQLGTDRTATVTFSLALGNMGNPQYRMKRSEEATAAAVFGQGEGTQRDYVTRTGSNYSAANDIEMYVDAKDIEQGDTAALQTRGDEKLQEAEAREEFRFSVLQTPASRYGVHYDLGDLVTAVNPFTGASLTQKIVAATVAVDEEGNETVDVEMEAP